MSYTAPPPYVNHGYNQSPETQYTPPAYSLHNNDSATGPPPSAFPAPPINTSKSTVQGFAAAAPPPPPPPPPATKELGFMDRIKAKARETAEAAAAAAAQAAADAATKMMKVNAHLSAGEEGTMANLKSKLSYIGSVAMAGGPEAYWRANFEPPKEERLLAYFGCHLATPNRLVSGVLFVGEMAAAFASDRVESGAEDKVGDVKQTILYSTTTCIQMNNNDHSQRYIGLVQNTGNVFWFTGFIEFDEAYHTVGQAFSNATTLPANGEAAMR